MKFDTSGTDSDGTAMMYLNGAFHGICGGYFWNPNNNNANLFCRKMGYDSGTMGDKVYSLDHPRIKVGTCTKLDTDIANCTGGPCNDYALGGYCQKSGQGRTNCNAYKSNGVKITCFESRNKCKGEMIYFDPLLIAYINSIQLHTIY